MEKIQGGQNKIVAVLKSLFFSYIITAIFLLLLALILYKLEPSIIVIRVGIILSYLISSFLGGIFVGKSTKEKKFLWGIIVGMLYFLIILLISFAMNQSILDKVGSMITVFAMCSLGGMLGGMVS